MPVSNCDLDATSELLTLHNATLKQNSDPVGLNIRGVDSIVVALGPSEVAPSGPR